MEWAFTEMLDLSLNVFSFCQISLLLQMEMSKS